MTTPAALRDDNTYRREARERKAAAIARTIYETARQANKVRWLRKLTEGIEHLSPELRAEWAGAAGQKDPSEETWEVVAYYLRRRLGQEEHPAGGAA